MQGSEPTEKNLSLGISDLAEDVFGLGLRGVKTIWMTIRNPRRLFRAARHPDWNYEFTPTIRVAFSILATMAVLRFFWFHDETMAYQLAYSDFEAKFPELSATEVATMTDRFSDWYIALFPFGFMLTLFLAASTVRVWGERGLSLRTRLFFSAIIPNLTLTLLLSPLMALSSSQAIVVSIAGIFGALALDFMTSLRGGVAGKTRLVRVAKASLVAIASIIAVILASLICTLLATWLAGAAQPS